MRYASASCRSPFGRPAGTCPAGLWPSPNERLMIISQRSVVAQMLQKFGVKENLVTASRNFALNTDFN
jgi:hypothetical protein